MFSKKLPPSPPSSPPPQYSPSLTQAPMASSKASYCFWSRPWNVKDVVQQDLNRDNKDENPSSSIVSQPLSPQVLQPRQSNEFQLGSYQSASEIFKKIPPKTITLSFSSWPGKLFSFTTTTMSDEHFLSSIPHLHLLSVVHRKHKLSSHKDEYLHMQVLNPTTNVVLHLVTQRVGTPEVAGPDYDKLHILSQADIADYSGGEEVCTLLCHRKAFSGSRPRFRDVIELLSAASKLSASERFHYYNSHSFSAAAGILIIENVCCIASGLYGKQTGSKQPRKESKKLKDFVIAVEISFYEGHFHALHSESEDQGALYFITKAISGCLSHFSNPLSSSNSS